MRGEIGDGTVTAQPGTEPSQGSWRRRQGVRVLSAILAVALIGAAFWLMLSRSVEMEFETHPPQWVIAAIPVVLSELWFGHQIPYTALTTVNERFYGSLPDKAVWSKSYNRAIVAVSEITPDQISGEYILLGPDDKGIVDLTKLAFLVLGFSSENVMELYYWIMAASCLVYIAAFWRSPSRLLLPAAFFGMFYLSMTMVKYNAQIGSPLTLRVLPVLSMVACLHCLLFMAGSLRAHVTAWQIGLVAVQVAVIAFTMHMKTSTLWQVMTICLFGTVVLVAASVRRAGLARVPWRSTALAVGSTAGMALAVYFGVQAYQAHALSEYSRQGQIPTRVFWHNIYSGMSLHPEFGERYRLRIDDASAYRNTGQYLAEMGRSDLWQQVIGEVPDYQGINFALYEPLVREMLFARCTTYVRECTETIFYYKPVALVGNLGWLYGLRDQPPNLYVVVPWTDGLPNAFVLRHYLEATRQMDRRGERAFLWTPEVVLIVAPFMLLVMLESRASRWTTFAGAMGLMLGSMIPTIFGYPIPHTILEAGLSVGMVFYLVVCCAVAAVLSGLAALVLTRRRQPEAVPSLATMAE